MNGCEACTAGLASKSGVTGEDAVEKFFAAR